MEAAELAGSLCLWARARADHAVCPRCGQPSGRVHSTYGRRLADAYVRSRAPGLRPPDRASPLPFRSQNRTSPSAKANTPRADAGTAAPTRHRPSHPARTARAALYPAGSMGARPIPLATDLLRRTQPHLQRSGSDSQRGPAISSHQTRRFSRVRCAHRRCLESRFGRCATRECIKSTTAASCACSVPRQVLLGPVEALKRKAVVGVG